MEGPTIDAGVLVSHSPTADAERLGRFARDITEAIGGELEQSTDATWRFHLTERTRLPNDDARRPSNFLDEASLQMVEGPYDLVIVVTDVGLVSSRRSIVGGLASPAQSRSDSLDPETASFSAWTAGSLPRGRGPVSKCRYSAFAPNWTPFGSTS